MILISDTHFTDLTADEYRWRVFPQVAEIMRQHKDYTLWHLGDLTDRKDRHSGALLNRMIAELRSLHAIDPEQVQINILMGNHDMPAKGEPFWNALNHLDDYPVSYITEPQEWNNGLVVFPYSHNPVEDWKQFKLSKFKAAFMHQTVAKASLGHGQLADGHKVPIFPRSLKVYSGDVHYPQTIGRVTYVGAAQRIRFGDEHECRALLLDDFTFEIKREFALMGPHKTVAKVESMFELDALNVGPGDRLRIRWTLNPSQVEGWQAFQDRIKRWASDHDIEIASIEAVVEQERDRSIEAQSESPVALLAEFAQAEGLDPALHAVGLALLEKELAS